MGNEEDPTRSLAKAVAEGPIKHSVNSVFDSINRGVESLDLLGKYTNVQKNQIRTQLENIKLLGMTSPIPLQKIYYPTYISTTIRRRLYEQEWLRQGDEKIEAPRKPAHRAQKETVKAGDEYVEKNNKVVILGGPGAGKTTFLKFIALVHADGIEVSATKIKNRVVPFFVQLPHFAKSNQSMLEFISEPLKKATDHLAVDFIKRNFAKGAAILILDSLDEVPLTLRSDVISKIRSFEILFPKSRIVLSCRTADYEETLENFCEVEISKLNHDAIKKIIQAWFEQDTTKAAQLINLIDSDDGVATLTETPLLLSLLCIQYRHDLVLPKRKAELYRRCIDTLLRDWDSTRGFRRESAYENMSDDRKERLFEHIAGNFFIDQELYEFKKEQLIPVVEIFIDRLDINKKEAFGLIGEIERHHGIIEQLSKEFYCFSHSSLQDYFVARHLLAKRIEVDHISKNIDNENWHPVIEFVVALAEDPSVVLQMLIRKSDFSGLSNFPPMARRTKLLLLLYRCMLSAPFVDKDVSNACFKHLVQSQIKMAEIFVKGMVIPLAELGISGVRHVLLHMDKPRTTLGDAIQPYRKFANQILISPLPGYADASFKAADALLAERKIIKGKKPGGIDDLKDLALLLNLLMPLGVAFPEEVRGRLATINSVGLDRLFKAMVSSSLEFISNEKRVPSR